MEAVELLLEHVWVKGRTGSDAYCLLLTWRLSLSLKRRSWWWRRLLLRGLRLGLLQGMLLLLLLVSRIRGLLGVRYTSLHRLCMRSRVLPRDELLALALLLSIATGGWLLFSGICLLLLTCPHGTGSFLLLLLLELGLEELLDGSKVQVLEGLGLRLLP